jgi:hypothetical protein
MGKRKLNLFTGGFLSRFLRMKKALVSIRSTSAFFT